MPRSRPAADRSLPRLVAVVAALAAWAFVCSWSATAQAQPATPDEPAGIDAADVGLVSSPPSLLERFEGATIVAVEVEQDGALWRRPLTQRVLEPGQPLASAAVRQALRALLEAGGVASAAAEVEPHPEGVVVHLRVAARRIAASVRVRVDGDKLPTQAVASAAGLSDGMELTERALSAIPGRVRALCVRKGYQGCEAKVETTDTDNPLRVVLTLHLAPGEREKVARRVFVQSAAVEAALGGLERGYDVGAGDPLDEEDLAEADRALTERLHKAGFLHGAVTHTVVRRTDPGGPAAFLFVYPQPGPRYHMAFDGHVQFSTDELTAALGLATATGVDPSELAERVRTFYRERGFYDATVEHEERGGPNDVEDEIRFHVHEGARVAVTERRFACLPPDREPDGSATDTGKLGLSADALGGEIDAVLEETLPRPSLLSGPDPVAVDAAFGPTEAGTSARPLRLRPATTYTPEAYQKALDHLRDYIHSKGYLNAVVGPIAVLRARCDPRARGSSCVPAPGPALPPPSCADDAVDLPVAEKPLGPEHECKPDPRSGVECSPALVLRIPVALGPRTQLYDLVFSGNEGKGYEPTSGPPEKAELRKREEVDARFASRVLADIAKLDLGGPVSTAALDTARQRLLDHYRDEGYPFASVTASIESSPDRTRARVRFDIHEGGPVEIADYEVRGNVRTSKSLILSRLDLCQDPPSCSPHDRLFRRDLVRASEQHIATLGVFSSVSVALEDPDIPLPKKRVLITVVEQGSQYAELRGGFSSGEGVRGAFEYGHRNIAGEAISLTLRLEMAYLPPPLIIDAGFRANYETLSLSEQLSPRASLSMRFPDIGLGPSFSLSVDGLYARTNQRDFGLSRAAAIPTLTYKPLPELVVQLAAPSFERNDVTLFGGSSLAEIIANNPGLATQLRVPEGISVTVAERLSATWDRRDNAFDAKSGTLLSGSIEHVNAFPIASPEPIVSDFLRMTLKFGGYIRLTESGVSIAAVVSGGYNQQLRSDSETYPDRLFFLGGVDSLRGFPLDSLVPQDLAVRIIDADPVLTTCPVMKPPAVPPCTRPFSTDDVPVRGGNLYWNPRLELRTPLSESVSLGWFLDTGNVWTSGKALKKVGDFFTLRYAAGAGVRLSTPLGPIVLDYGFNLVRRPWEDLGALHFAVGLF